ncbi:protein SON-like [Colletes gigas]|uniref:protein SON-like n=1 Tax=Colletes gigas TaxID=935657 RepID=UPI001C9A420F|nr:protein SON-like [Colletes gigas]
MVNESAKALTMVISAIRNLREAKGSSSREILHYLSSMYNIPPQVARRQMLTALKRGVSYGILKKTGVNYVLPTSSEMKCQEIAAQEVNLLDFCRRSRGQQKLGCKCKKKQQRRTKRRKKCRCKSGRRSSKRRRSRSRRSKRRRSRGCKRSRRSSRRRSRSGKRRRRSSRRRSRGCKRRRRSSRRRMSRGCKRRRRPSRRRSRGCKRRRSGRRRELGLEEKTQDYGFQDAPEEQWMQRDSRKKPQRKTKDETVRRRRSKSNEKGRNPSPGRTSSSQDSFEV